MTEEEVVSVRGGEIPDSGDADQHKIKAQYCNGVAHENGNEVPAANGAVSVAITDDGVVSAGNSGASDLDKAEIVAVGESDVAVVSEAAAEEAECECEAVNNKNENNDCEEKKTEISNGTISVGGDSGNDEGSVVVSDVLGDGQKDVTDASEIHDREFEAQNGAENEIHSDGAVAIVGVNGAESNGIHQNGDEVEKGVSRDEVKDDVVAVAVEKEESAEANGSNSELESVAVENGVDVNKENSDVSYVKERAGEEDGQSNSVEKAQVIEALDSGGGDEKEDGGNVAAEGTGESSVSDEKNVVANVVQEVTDREFENMTNGYVQNGSVDEQEVSECGKKDENEIPVGVDGVASAAVDLKESENEDMKISSDVEEPKVETVPDLDADNSVVDAEIPIESESSRNDSVVEVSEVESGQNLVTGEDSSASDSTNVRPGDGNVVSDVNDIAVESEAEPSTVAVESEAEPSTEPVESEAEPSTEPVESEAEPSTEPVESEVEPSTVAVESESEPLNIAVETEAEVSTVAVENEVEPSTVAAESEADSSNIAVVESEAEPSAEGKISVEHEVGNGGDEETRPVEEGSSTDALDGQNVGSEVVRRPFYYLIRIPRYDDDENIKDQINIAFQQVEEKTRIRDAIRAESQAKKGICREYNQEFRAALSEERAARDLFKSKRQELDSVQSTMNRLNNAISVGDIDGKIRNMERMIQHETLPLKEEKQLIRQIKQLKQSREELSSIIAKQDQAQQALDNKDSIEENLKKSQLLRKEVDSLRNNVQKAEVATKAARKKYDDEVHKVNEISVQFKAADDIRQEAYAKLQKLKKQLHEKSKYFWDYKNASKKGQELAAEGKREELQCFCIDQVERIMEMWNKNDEFRRDYVRCNTRSTLRRLQTLDGRSLGPDEEPPAIPNAFTERVSKNNSLISQSTPHQEKKSTITEPASIKDEPISKADIQKTEKSQTTKTKKPAKPAPLEKPVAPISRWGDEPDDIPEEPVRTKEEEEQIIKAEKARKEEEEARLKEKRRLEEIEKAKEAMERKKRNAEKAQQRAALKAQKEAEQKEKAREKRLRKKERRQAASTETAEHTEQEPAPVPETITRGTEECDQSERPVEVAKRQQKPSQFTRQTKAKSIPLPLRNRGKRRIQPWMWWALIAVLVIVALFFFGNSSALRSWLPGPGY